MQCPIVPRNPNGTSSERHLSIVLQIPGAPTRRAVGQQLSRKIACMAVFKQQSQRKRPVVRFNPLPYSRVLLTNLKDLKADFKSGFARIEILYMVVRYRNNLRSKRPLTSQKNVLNQNKRWNSVCMQSVQEGWAL